MVAVGVVFHVRGRTRRRRPVFAAARRRPMHEDDGAQGLDLFRHGGRHEVVAAAEPDHGKLPARELPPLPIRDVHPPHRAPAQEMERDLGVPIVQGVPVEKAADPEIQGLDGGIRSEWGLVGRPPPGALALRLPVIRARGASPPAFPAPARPARPPRILVPGPGFPVGSRGRCGGRTVRAIRAASGRRTGSRRPRPLPDLPPAPRLAPLLPALLRLRLAKLLGGGEARLQQLVLERSHEIQRLPGEGAGSRLRRQARRSASPTSPAIRPRSRRAPPRRRNGHRKSSVDEARCQPARGLVS